MQNTQKPQASAQLAAAQLTALLEASDEAIVSYALDGTILSWSRSAGHIYGYKAAEMVGRSMSVLLPSECMAELDMIVNRVARGERIEHLETVRVAKDGRKLAVSLSATPIRDETEAVTGVLTIIQPLNHDATERRRAEATVREMQVHARHRGVVLETASRVALDILASRTGVEALHHIADAARVLANARYAALGVARADGNGLSEFVTVGLTPAEEARIGPRPRGEGVLGLLLSRPEPLRVNNLADHPASVGFPPDHPPMDSFLGVPIRRGNVVLGSLYLTNKQGGESFTEADEVAVQALGAHAAVAIHNLQMLARQRALVSGLIAAQEEERRAVAYDLHDGLTQFVMAAHAHLDTFRRMHESGNAEKAAREMEHGLKYLKEAVVESRRLVNGLRSLALDDLGLAGALEQLVHEEKARAGWDTADFIHNIVGRRFDKSLETGVYRVAQEALTNARKHAGASQVRLLVIEESKTVGGASDSGSASGSASPDSGSPEATITASPSGGPVLRLQVRDWGRGFEPEQQVVDTGHVGLQGMYERVHLLGGVYALTSTPGEGTIVSAIFPVLEPEPEDEADNGLSSPAP